MISLDPRIAALMVAQPFLAVALGKSTFARVCRLFKGRTGPLRLTFESLEKNRAMSYVYYYVFGLQLHVYLTFFLKCCGMAWLPALAGPLLLVEFRVLKSVIGGFLRAILQLRHVGKFGLLNLVLWVCAMAFLATTMQRYRDDTKGIHTMWMNAYGDFPFHMGMIMSFSANDNFPPQYHILEGNKLTYPFMVNVWASQFFGLGEPHNFHNISWIVGYQWFVVWVALFFFLRGHRYHLMPWCLLLTGGTYFTIGKFSEERDVLYGKYPWATFMTTIWAPQRSAPVGLMCTLAAVSLFMNYLRESGDDEEETHTKPKSDADLMYAGKSANSASSLESERRHALEKMLPTQLVPLCRQYGLPEGGLKGEVIDRILEFEFVTTSSSRTLRSATSLADVEELAELDLDKQSEGRFYAEPRILLAGLILSLSCLFHVHFALFAILYVGVALVWRTVLETSFTIGRSHYHIAIGDRRWLFGTLTYIVGLLPSFLSLPWLLAGKRTAGMVSIMFGWSEVDDPTRSIPEQLWTSAACWTRNAWQLFVVLWVFWLVSRQHKNMVPWWFLFALANFVKLAPWIWDHMKVFIGLYAVFLAIWANSRTKSRKLYLLHFLLILVFLPGAIEVGRIVFHPNDHHSSAAIWTGNELALTNDIIKYTPKEATIMGRDIHNSPIAPSGRRIFKGFPAWIITHGLDDYKQNKVFLAKLKDMERICMDDEIRPLCPDYLLWGPSEQDHWRGQDPRDYPFFEDVGTGTLFRLRKKADHYFHTGRGQH